MEEYGAASSAVEWIPRWPQKLSWLGLLTASLIAPLALLAPVALAQGAADSSAVTALGIVGFGCACGATVVGVLADSGFRYLGLSRRVVAVSDSVHGSGVRIGQRRFTVGLTVAVLSMLALYAVLAAVAWTGGYGSRLLPAERDNRAGAMFMAGVALVLVAVLALMMLVRNVCTLTICSSGIQRSIKRRRLLRVDCADTFLRWDEIDDVIADDYVVHVGRSSANPIIRLVHEKSDLDLRKVGQDRRGEVVISAYTLASEPNMLLGLIDSMRDEATRRFLLRKGNARELLRPPPLSVRLRKSR